MERGGVIGGDVGALGVQAFLDLGIYGSFGWGVLLLRVTEGFGFLGASS